MPDIKQDAAAIKDLHRELTAALHVALGAYGHDSKKALLELLVSEGVLSHTGHDGGGAHRYSVVGPGVWLSDSTESVL